MVIKPEILDKMQHLTPEQQMALEEYLSKLLNENTTKKIPFESLLGVLKGKISVSEDFDAPLEEFKDYM